MLAKTINSKASEAHKRASEGSQLTSKLARLASRGRFTQLPPPPLPHKKVGQKYLPCSRPEEIHRHARLHNVVGRNASLRQLFLQNHLNRHMKGQKMHTV